MDLQRLFQELKRRNVFRVATAYAITGWLIIQVVATTAPQLGFPEWVPPFVTVLVLVGFPLALIFAWAFELTPEGLKKSEEVDITESVTNRTGKKLNGIIITVLSMAVIFLLVERVFFAEAAFIENAEMENISTASIAVLPFQNMSSDEENEFFSDGLSEELLNVLAKVDGIKVAGRTSSFQFKGQNLDLRDVGEKLGVKHVLEGSVRKSGNQIRITAQLINAEDGYHIWSETYDRELTDIFAIQDEISQAVLGQLKGHLLPEDNENLRASAMPTTDVEAYQAYLKGNTLIAKRDIDAINIAIDQYKTALRLDPSFAEAYGRLAIAYNLQGYYGNIPFEQVQESVKQNAEQALAINEDEPNAYAALGLYHLNRFEAEEAVEFYEKSIGINPNNSDVYNWLGNAQSELGNYKKGNEAYKKMYEVEPLAPFSIYNRAVVHYYEGEFDQAIALFEQNMTENPEFSLSYSGMAQLKGLSPFGDLDESVEYALKARDYGRDGRALTTLLIRTIDLEIEPMADDYFRQLKDQYSENYEYLSAIPYYAIYKQDFSYLEEDLFSYIDEQEITLPELPFYLSLRAYGKATGDYDRVFNEFEKFDPTFFGDEIPPLSLRNISHAFELSQTYGDIGNEADQQKLLEVFCLGVEELKEEFDQQEDGEAYTVSKYQCLTEQGEYDEALPYFRKTFIDMNRKLAAWYLFEDLPEEAKAREDYQQIIEEVRTELSEQRENVIQMLQERGEWDVEN